MGLVAFGDGGIFQYLELDQYVTVATKCYKPDFAPVNDSPVCISQQILTTVACAFMYRYG